jgi:glycosyltransferase involved in cell wall biosynthesis
MDVLFVSRCLPYPTREGDRLILGHLLAHLRGRGHRCDLVALDEAPASGAGRAAAVEQDPGIEVVPARPRHPLQYATRLLRPFPGDAAHCWNPALWRTVERRLAARHYDVVHLFGGIQVYELRGLVAGRPTVITPYESYSLRLERACAAARSTVSRTRIRLRLAAARAFERVIFNGFDRVVVLGEPDRAALLALQPSLPIEVIPNGVELNTVPRDVREPVLVFVGNYAYEPNVHAARLLALDVLPRVKRHVPEARAVLIGPEPPPGLRALASPDVVLTGWVDDVRPSLARAAVVVAPLAEGAGMKNKILEAMAAGAPVVTTPVGCDGIAAIDERDVLLASTPEATAEAVVALLRDTARAERLGAAGRALVRSSYRWEDVAGRYERLYAELAAARSPAAPA